MDNLHDKLRERAKYIQTACIEIQRTVGSPRPVPDIDWLESQLEEVAALALEEVRRYAVERWDEDVSQRPKKNIYRAGMDRAWKTLEEWASASAEELRRGE